MIMISSVVRGSRRTRTGFILPTVIVGMVVVAALVGAAQLGAWRSVRAARVAWNGERALHSADEAIARTLAHWNRAAFAASGVGSRRTTTITTASGAIVDVTIVRTEPLGAWIVAHATSQLAGSPFLARRKLARAVAIASPPLPIDAALVVLTPLHLAGGAQVSGIDDASLRDACGPWRDTASIGGVHARVTTRDPAAVVVGAPPIITAIDSSRDDAEFDAAWRVISSRATARTIHSTTGVIAPAPAWHVSLLRDSAGVQLRGSLDHQGTLAVDADLVVEGTLRVRGLLIVRGNIDATRGQLIVDGAVVAKSPRVAGTQLGAGTRIRYAPCDVRMAIAAVSVPSTSLFRVWSER